MRKRTPRRLAAALLGLLAVYSQSPQALAGPRNFVSFVTRLGGDPEAAQPYIAKFLDTLEGPAGWPKGSTKGNFVTTRKEALAYIESSKPGLGMMEPQLYLELRKSHDLTPIAQVVSPDLASERLHLVVKDPAIQDLAGLKGKRLVTTLADAPQYLSRVVLAGKVDARQHFQTIKGVGQAMKGARAVLRGEADATLLDDEQLAAAQKLEGGAALRSVHDSPALPPLVVVVFGKALKPEEQKKLSKVLTEMCGTPKGGEVCKEMHITKFAPVSSPALADAQKRFEQP